MNDIKMGSIIEYRKPGGVKKTGRVEWVYIDAYTQQPYYRVRPDIGKRAIVHQEDIKRAEVPKRTRRPK